MSFAMYSPPLSYLSHLFRLARHGALAAVLLAPAVWAAPLPYIVNADLTVTDQATGLVWDQCYLGQGMTGCLAGASTVSWENALNSARDANASAYKGHTDWRLPNVKELESLVDIAKLHPSIDTVAFPGALSATFWSSTTRAPDPADAWLVSFYSGNINIGSKTGIFYVRLVRSGQSFAFFDSLDTTAPLITAGPTATPGADGATASVSVTVGEAATGFWQVLPAADTPPDASALLALGAGQQVALAASVAGTIPVVGLDKGTAYVLYFVAKDGSGNASTVESAAFTTASEPAAPTSVAATAGNAQASVSWVAPTDNGSTVTGYTATAVEDTSKHCTPAPATDTTCTVTGLANGTAYTFMVTATNGVGTGLASAASSAVTPARAPDAATGVSATAGNAQATVNWVAPAFSGGSPLTGYRVEVVGDATKYCTPTPVPATDSSCTITGLANGTAYAFQVFAINAVGSSPASVASGNVTPFAPVVPPPPPPPEPPAPPPPPPPPISGPITVPANGSATLSGPGSAQLGSGSTLTVGAGAAGSPITPPATGSAALQLGTQGAPGSVTVARAPGGGTPAQLVALAPAGGAGQPVLRVESGSAQLSSALPGQPLLDVGTPANGPLGAGSVASGQQVLAGAQGGQVLVTALEGGRTLVTVQGGSASVPCGSLCPPVGTPPQPGRIELLPGEAATFSQDGQAVHLEAALPPLAPPTVFGLSLGLTVPVVRGASVPRLPGELLDAAITAQLSQLLGMPLQALGQGGHGAMGWLADGVHLTALPLGPLQINTTLPEGASLLPNGRLRVVVQGLVMEFAPMPGDLLAAMRALRAIDPLAQLQVQPDGVWRVTLSGQPLVFQPSWIGVPGAPLASAGFALDGSGQLLFVDGSGLRTPLYPALADAQGLAGQFRALDAQMQLEVRVDGVVQLRLGGQDYVLAPQFALLPVPAGREGQVLWLESGASGDLLLWMRLQGALNGGLAQVMRVQGGARP